MNATLLRSRRREEADGRHNVVRKNPPPYVGGYMALVLAMLVTLVGSSVLAQQASTNSVRFIAVDIFVDTKAEPLAAYQLEFAATNGVVKIVGVEGGEHPAFRAAPHYDPKAMQRERVIIAAFSTDTQLPYGKTRVATIHLQVRGATPPQFTLKLETAANSAGKKISATARFEERKGR